MPPLDAGGFQAAGAVRATPYDQLAFLEAQLRRGDAPPELAPALRAVRRPVLRRGLTHRHVHTIAWFRHPTDGGPMSVSLPGAGAVRCAGRRTTESAAGERRRRKGAGPAQWACCAAAPVAAGSRTGRW
ncbi:hypothetical protein GCM10010309_70540 [Streptomyces violaceochromogenes]|nr:hypothetical protein GCM10010309_70540 [Streptomyces violaceochromogenes]